MTCPYSVNYEVYLYRSDHPATMNLRGEEKEMDTA